MDDLVMFLKKRYDEIEKAARFVLSDYAQHDSVWRVTATGLIYIGDDYLLTHDGPLANHIAYHDPAHVLDDIAAKRQIIKFCRQPLVLQLLAVPFATYSGYREEWCPYRSGSIEEAS